MSCIYVEETSPVDPQFEYIIDLLVTFFLERYFILFRHIIFKLFSLQKSPCKVNHEKFEFVRNSGSKGVVEKIGRSWKVYS